jgi:hypothetical protein
MKHLARLSLAVFSLFVTSTVVAQYNQDSFSAMHWRLIGLHRAGRVTAVAGIPGKPAIYYFGTPGGGVWKTVNGGRVWTPIFDDAHVASIGALALAPSNPEIIYVGTGEETAGNGIYKSTDAGRPESHRSRRYALHHRHHRRSKRSNVVVVSVRVILFPGRRVASSKPDGGRLEESFLQRQNQRRRSRGRPDDPRTIYAATYNLQFDVANRRALGAESDFQVD